MPPCRAIALCALVACSTSEQRAPSRFRQTGQPMRQVAGGWVTDVPMSGIRGTFSGGDTRITHRGATVRLQSVSLGRDATGAALRFDAAAPGDCLPDRTTRDGRCLRPLSASAGDLTERWISRADGLEQTWTLDAPPPGVGALRIGLRVEGARASVKDGLVHLRFEVGHTMDVGGLRATDATGRVLNAWFEASADGFSVRVDDDGARYPVQIDPLYSAPGWTLADEGADDPEFGASVAGRVDINGDGLPDMIVGASAAAGGEGSAHVYLGASDAPRYSPDFTLDGFGWMVDGAGDFNGDGLADLAAGDPAEDGGAGAMTICPSDADGPDCGSPLVLTGGAAGDAFATAAAAADLNGDGYDDLIVGAPGAESGAGRVSIFYGGAAGLSATPDLSIDGDAAGDGLGRAVSAAGDTDGDGYADLIVGAPYVGGTSGAATVIRGAATGLDVSSAITLSGTSGMTLGFSVAGAGDVNADGYDDVVVAAPGTRAVYAYLGSSTGVSSAPASTLSSPRTSSTGTGSDGFGWKVVSAGDYDGDGYDDVMVGIELYAGSRWGYLFRGGATGLSSSYSTYLTSSVTTGFAGGALGDLNGDGHEDLAFAFPTFLTTGGFVRVASDPVSIGTFNNNTYRYTPPLYQGYGTKAAAAGDLNGDGYADFVVQASKTLRWDLYYGASAGPSSTPDLSFAADEGYSTPTYRAFSGGCDLNGDGRQDLVAIADQDTGETLLEVYLGAASGISSAPSYSAMIDEGWSGTCIPDFTGDGYDDVVTVGSCESVGDVDTGDEPIDNCLRLLRGAASGLDPTPDDFVVTLAAEDRGPRLVPAGDVNGDGLGDLLLGFSADDADYGGILVYYGSASGLGDAADFGYPPYDSGWGYSVAPAGDVNGDGYDDIVTGAHYEGSGLPAAARVFYGSATGLSSTSTTRIAWDDWDDPLVGYPFVAGVADLDDDGSRDVVIVGPSRARFGPGALMLFSGGTGGVEVTPSQQIFPFESSGGSPTIDCVVEVGDVNGDGAPDLLTCSKETAAHDGHYDLFYGYSDGEAGCDDTDPLVVKVVFYADTDGDGFGDAGDTVLACEAPAGFVADNTDCDDSDAAVNPGAAEICDPGDQDEDCDGLSDDADDSVDEGSKPRWYSDADGDGFGEETSGVLACDPAAGWSEHAGDCDDADADIHPGAPERCDGVDHDCDGAVNEPESVDVTPWYADADGDLYGDPAAPTPGCEAPAGSVADDTDCDDADASVNPGAVEICDGADEDEDCDGLSDDADGSASPDTMSTWYSDVDGDGFGDEASAASSCDAASGQTSDAEDCDDTDPEIYPGAIERCDGEDDDCDGELDEPDAVDAPTWYADADGDLYGDAAAATVSCEAPAGSVADDTDCDDADPDVNPGAAEICDVDDLDEDCDGLSDDADGSASPDTMSTWYSDVDGDGFGDEASAASSCDAASGQIGDAEDCDDTDPDIYPGAIERCDGEDDDCDGEVDEPDAADASTWYADADGDLYGDAAAATVSCEAPAGSVADDTDCDDADPDVNPGATEICDPFDVDEDCDGLSDDADDSADPASMATWYSDLDGDTFGDALSALTACDPGPGQISLAGDCDDGDAEIYPGAIERCDGVDDDCDGEVDEADAVDASTWYADADGDLYGDPDVTTLSCEAPAGAVADSTDCDDADASAFPGATEIVGDGVDQDCDGVDAVDTGSAEDSAEPGAEIVSSVYKGGCGSCSSAGERPGPLGWVLALTLARRRRRGPAARASAPGPAEPGELVPSGLRNERIL